MQVGLCSVPRSTWDSSLGLDKASSGTSQFSYIVVTAENSQEPAPAHGCCCRFPHFHSRKNMAFNAGGTM